MVASLDNPQVDVLHVPRPGYALPEYHLYEQKMISTPTGLKEMGIRTPAGLFYFFKHGEGLVLERSGRDRVPMIRLENGDQVTFSAWQKTRYEQNAQSFERVRPEYADLYMNLLSQYPALEQLDVVISTPNERPDVGTSIGSLIVPEGNEQLPFVYINEDENETLDALDDKVALNELADVMGISIDTLRANPRILHVFVLLHEIGHGYDFVANYLNSPSMSSEGYNPMVAMNENAKKELMTLLVPGLSPSRVWKMWEQGSLNLTKYYEEYRDYYLSKGLHSAQELFDQIQRDYRKLPKEKFADDFALDAIRRNWNRLGFDSIAPAPKVL